MLLKSLSAKGDISFVVQGYPILTFKGMFLDTKDVKFTKETQSLEDLNARIKKTKYFNSLYREATKEELKAHIESQTLASEGKSQLSRIPNLDKTKIEALQEERLITLSDLASASDAILWRIMKQTGGSYPFWERVREDAKRLCKGEKEEKSKEPEEPESTQSEAPGPKTTEVKPEQSEKKGFFSRKR